MYLAPLNYDRYFKKVFGDVKIAKRFLEDFFDVTIESIELLTNEHKITDAAVLFSRNYGIFHLLVNTFFLCGFL